MYTHARTHTRTHTRVHVCMQLHARNSNQQTNTSQQHARPNIHTDHLCSLCMCLCIEDGCSVHSCDSGYGLLSNPPPPVTRECVVAATSNAMVWMGALWNCTGLCFMRCDYALSSVFYAASGARSAFIMKVSFQQFSDSSHTLTHSHTRTHTHTHALTHSHTHSHALTHSHTLSQSLTISRTHTLKRARTLTHTHTPTHPHSHTRGSSVTERPELQLWPLIFALTAFSFLLQLWSLFPHGCWVCVLRARRRSRIRVLRAPCRHSGIPRPPSQTIKPIGHAVHRLAARSSFLQRSCVKSAAFRVLAFCGPCVQTTGRPSLHTGKDSPAPHKDCLHWCCLRCLSLSSWVTWS